MTDFSPFFIGNPPLRSDCLYRKAAAKQRRGDFPARSRGRRKRRLRSRHGNPHLRRVRIGMAHRVRQEKDGGGKGSGEKRTAFPPAFGIGYGRLLAVLLLRHSEGAGKRRRPDRPPEHPRHRTLFSRRVQRKIIRKGMSRINASDGGNGMYGGILLKAPVLFPSFPRPRGGRRPKRLFFPIF